MQLSGRLSSDDFEVPVLNSTEGCYWRLEYIKNIAIPGHLKCALAFLNYPVVRRWINELMNNNDYLDFDSDISITIYSFRKYKTTSNRPTIYAI